MKKILALLFLASPAFSTVIVDTQTAAGIDVTVGISSWTMTLGAGINKAVVVGCETNAGSPVGVSSMTIGSQVAYKIGQTQNSLDLAELWIATGVVSGNQTIKAYLNGAGGYTDAVVLCGAVGLENVHQTSPVDVSTGAVNMSSVTFTTTVSTTLIVDVAGQGTDAEIPEPDGNQTLQWGDFNPSRFTGVGGSTKDGGQAGSKTMSWTIASNNAMQAAAIKTAAGAPDISSISPATKGIGTGQFTLTVTGQNFVSGATVTWNGLNRATTFVSATELTAVILSTDVVTIGLFPVRVINPDTSRSNIVNFNLTGDITYVWATDGGYKPTQEDLYGTENSTTVAATRIWDGTTIKPFQAKNELNGFALILENNTIVNSTMVRVGYPVLTHTSGYTISSTEPTKSTLWDWRNRPISVYYVRYLPIQGLSRLHYEDYDELHVPPRMRATFTVNGNGQGIRSGEWTSRVDADKNYPDILVPIEALGGSTLGSSTFTVASSSSQAIWFDIYVPKTAPPGLYSGTINVFEGAQLSTAIPINLTVYPFTMPDVPTAKPYAYLSLAHVNWRMGSTAYPNYGGMSSTQTITRWRFYQELWRHGVTPIGDTGEGACQSLLQYGPCPEFAAQLNGSLFAPTSGYANAPGVLTGVPVYSMWTYGGWRSASYWGTTGSSATCTNANIWTQWFQKNAPKAEYWWYLEDEAADLTNNGIYSTWASTCPAPGNALKPYATVHPKRVDTEYPNIAHVSTTRTLGIIAEEEEALQRLRGSGHRRVSYYNGARPWSGSMATEDTGIAMRVGGWMQFKKKFDHYFIWDVTNYTSGSNVNVDLFHDAHTFGFFTSTSATIGRTGFNYSNGDGVLMFPGTDTLFPNDSYGVDVPFPSWRLKMWRRGINDHTYLTLASKYDGKRVNAIVNRMIPKVIWEYGVFDTGDPTYNYGTVSWSEDANVWETAREELADIISRHR